MIHILFPSLLKWTRRRYHRVEATRKVKWWRVRDTRGDVGRGVAQSKDFRPGVSPLVGHVGNIVHDVTHGCPDVKICTCKSYVEHSYQCLRITRELTVNGGVETWTSLHICYLLVTLSLYRICTMYVDTLQLGRYRGERVWSVTSTSPCSTSLWWILYGECSWWVQSDICSRSYGKE